MVFYGITLSVKLGASTFIGSSALIVSISTVSRFPSEYQQAKPSQSSYFSDVFIRT